MKNLVLILIASIAAMTAHAQSAVEYRTELAAHAATGTFAPYYLTANRYGTIDNACGAYLRAGVFIPMDSTRRFSYAAGIDLLGNCETTSPVKRWETDHWVTNHERPSIFRIQQLYADIKYRSVFLSVGIKERDNDNPITDRRLSSGNLVSSGNTRPIPQIEAGFHRFVNIPLTNGWVQIKGNIAYGKFIDDNYLRSHYNYYTSFLTTNVCYHYKSVFFRSKPDMPFVFTIGIEDGVQFCGTKETYRKGNLEKTEKADISLKAFVQAFLPSAGDESAAQGDQLYVFGNHVGAINMAMQYTFRNRYRLKLYTQWLYEDGSGMGKFNGWDGLWGISFSTQKKSIVSDVVIEYLDLSNQSGAIPWEPNDRPGTLVTTRTSGGDDYYNNFYFNGWQHYGHGIGTPMSPSIMYNTDGYLRFLYTRLRGGHLALQGFMNDEWSYRLLGSVRTSWGTPFIPLRKTVHQASFLIECSYTPAKLQGWSFCGSVALDYGDMLGDNTGIFISIAKSGTLFKFKK